MFVSPSKIKQNKLLRGRTISFETANKTHGNMVIIPTVDKDALTNTIKSSLFRPMQLLALYTPRRIKPRGRQVVTVNQKDYYADMRASTNNRIKKGKTLIAAYNGQNLIYDIYNSYNIKAEALSKLRKLRMLQNDLIDLFEDEIYTATHDPDYPMSYLVFPMSRPYPNPQKVFVSGTDFSITDPLGLFIASIIRGDIDYKKYENVKMVFFYVPKEDILLAVDIHRPDFITKVWPTLQQRLKRMNALNAGEETLESLADDLEDEATGIAELSKEDRLENTKEEIKQLALTKVASDIHARNLTDFEAASGDERDIMVSIDKKIDDYLAKPENLSKTVNDMVNDLEKDDDIKAKTVKYVETKKASVLRADTLAKGMEKETDIIDNMLVGEDDDRRNDGKEIDVDIKDFDPRMRISHFASIDSEYEKKQAKKDILNIVSSFSSKEFIPPMTVDSISFEDTSTFNDEISTMHVRYKTSDGRPISFNLDIPKFIDDKYLYIGGSRKVIKKQLVRLPIVKVKPDRVEITTNYNKWMVDRTSGNISRKNAYIFSKLKELDNNPAFKIEYGDNRAVNSKLEYSNDFEYEELAGKINNIKNSKYRIYFNRDDMRDELDLLDIPDSFFTRNMTPLGIEGFGENSKAIIFIEDEKIYRYELSSKETREISESLFDFLISDIFMMDINSLPKISDKGYMYTKIHMLGVWYPLLSVVGSCVGLTSVLKRYNVKYYFSEKPEKRTDYISVKFKDKYLNYENIIKNTLLLSSLVLLNPHEYTYDQFDADIPYTHYFMRTFGNSVGLYTRVRLKLNLDLMIDPITREILRDLKQPTDIVDVLLYANTLLVGNQYKTINNMTNYRIRSNELVPACMYSIIAEAYRNYCEHKINGNPINISIPKGALIAKLLQLPDINAKSTLNPVEEIEHIAQTSAKGFNGVNINDAYTLEMRSYDKTMNGFLSGNSTPYSGQAGITRALSYDPMITSVRGYIPEVDENTLSAANMLSPTELLAAYTAAGADAPRQAMQVAQTGHTMPILHSSKQLIGSGMNKTLAYLITDDFCFKAKRDGIVEKIDTKNKVAILKYNDDTYDSIDLDDKLEKNSNMGFYIHCKMKIVYKEGESFKKDDVIAFMPEYFSGKGKNIDYHPGALAKVAIASGDFSFEDSTIICETLGKKCEARINMLEDIALEKNTIIHKIVKAGDHVVTGDSLLEYTAGYDDPDTADFLLKLGSAVGDEALDKVVHDKIKTMYTGEVTDVEIFYNCPFEELSPSLQALIKEYKKNISDRNNAVAGKNASKNVHVPPLEQVFTRKIGTKEFPADGGVIINIYVEYIDEMGMGDKLT